ncbi:MAG TPA: hypothetical protein DCP92_11365 [Nitrospiraceae bacterium]|jgi:hypothetical protein|nr:hypothetical protein [Nitrospiraceae bacterium]
MISANLQNGFDPVRCYEELRVNILEDPFYSSWGKDVLQNRGMLCWLDSVNMFNVRITADDMPERETMAASYNEINPDDGFRNKLKTLLADITVNLYREALYA